MANYQDNHLYIYLKNKHQNMFDGYLLVVQQKTPFAWVNVRMPSLGLGLCTIEFFYNSNVAGDITISITDAQTGTVECIIKRYVSSKTLKRLKSSKVLKQTSRALVLTNSQERKLEALLNNELKKVLI